MVNAAERENFLIYLTSSVHVADSRGMLSWVTAKDISWRQKYSHLVFAHDGEWFSGLKREMVYVFLYVHAWYKSATSIYLGKARKGSSKTLTIL